MSRLNLMLRQMLAPSLLRAGERGQFFVRNSSTVGSGQGFVREAKQEDYKAVMEITPDVYGGRDYLPCVFPSFVRDSHVHSYVFELDGRVVGFEAAQAIDGGTTIVTRAGRVSEDCRGHGVMKRLRKHIVDKLTSDHSVKCISMTTSNTTGLATKPSVLRTNKEVFRRDVHVFPYEVSKLDLPEEPDFKTATMSQLGVSQLCEIFKNPAMSSYLFPHDRMIINTIPFRLMEENAEPIQLENPFIIISDKLREQKSAYTNGIMSATTWFSCKAGICVDLEFYGLSTSFPELCNHVARHLHHVKHLATHGHIMVPHSHRICKDVLFCAFARHGLAPADSPFKTQYLFEEYLEDESSVNRAAG